MKNGLAGDTWEGYGTVSCTRVILTYPVAPEGRSAIILVDVAVSKSESNTRTAK